MDHFTYLEILFRLLFAVICGAAVGYDREINNHPAGLRTHELVCVSAAILAMIQIALNFEVSQMAEQSASFATAVKIDSARIPAAIISGIGFLGAGTIIVRQRTVTGLTTAATLWSVAGLGLAIGMGLYLLAGIGLIVILFALYLSSRLLNIKAHRRVSIKYSDHDIVKPYILDYCEKNQIKIKPLALDYITENGEKIFTDLYGISLPANMSYDRFVNDLSQCTMIKKISLVDLPV